jgi:hypothetical protein
MIRPDLLRSAPVARALALAGAGLVAASLGTGARAAESAGGAATPASSSTLAAGLVCTADPEPPEYYAIPLVTTKNVPGTAFTKGAADVTFAPSPFAVSVAADGSYDYDVHVRLDDLPEPPRGGYVAWVTTTQVDRIERLGALEDGQVTGQVRWNKFLVVVTLEDEPEAEAERWSGPIAFRGMSRSGKMHTMAGHGPFEEERCATYGYGG